MLGLILYDHTPMQAQIASPRDLIVLLRSAPGLVSVPGGGRLACVALLRTVNVSGTRKRPEMARMCMASLQGAVVHGPGERCPGDKEAPGIGR
jgi:hypothetical protein